MSTTINPFIYGGPVGTQIFFGRDSEINTVFDRIGSHARESVAIVGERRIGKTSLLHYVSAPDVTKRWNLNQEQSIFVFMDCGTITPFTITNFWKSVLRHVKRTLRKRGIAPEILEGINDLLVGEEITPLDIEFLLEDMQESDLVFVLLLDEFEGLIRTDPENEALTRDFLVGLRALINHRSRVLSLIVATRQPLNEICRDIRFMGSPFYNNFIFLHLRPFSMDEAEGFLEQMLVNTTISFSREEKDYIYALAGTHPLLIQTASALVFDCKVSGLIEVKDLLPIRSQFIDLIEHQFEDFWRWSQPREREILTLFAQGNYQEANALLIKWSDERDRLLKRGLIISDLSDTFTIFSSVFLEWLIDNMYRLDELRSPSNPEISHLKQQLSAHNQRLHKLQELEAKRGIDTPVHMVVEMEEIEIKIKTLEAKINKG